MNRSSKLIFRAAFACAAALLFVVPRTARADDTTKPSATLYSPYSPVESAVAAVSEHQKIILSLSEPVTLSSVKTVSVSSTGGIYTAYASDGVKIGSESYGPWYVAYDLSKFLNGTETLSLANGTTYTVVAEAEAFSDAAGNKSGLMSGTFTTVAAGTIVDPVAVVYTTTNANQTVKAGETSIARGQAVATGTTLTFTIPADGGYTTSETVKAGGVEVTDANLSNYVLAGDLEVYIVRTGVAGFSGTAVISGDTYYGGELSGNVTGANQTDSSQWTFSWVRVDGGTDTPLLSGDITTAGSYTLTEDDIGKVIRLDVTDAVMTGTLSDTTAAISKAPYSGAAAAVPVSDAITSTSITLKEVTGYEYSSDNTTFSSTRTFSVASAGTTVTLYQRVAATATMEASASASASFTSAETLNGTVSFSSTTAQSGVELTASFTNAGTGTGPYSYRWTREGTEVATTAAYTPGSADVGKVLTVSVTSNTQSGSVSGNTSAVLKAVSTAGKPAAPTMASATATSITLNAVSGYQYSLGGVYWQDTTTFHNLVAGSTYTFYQRVAETTTELASQASDGANFSTLPGLTGTILSSGEARYGFTLTVSLSGTNNTGTLTYTWLRGAVVAGTGQSYTVQAIDIGNQLSLQVTSSDQGGSITRSYGTVSKAYYYGDTPAAPTRSSRTTTKIVLTSVSGCEYSRDGSTWQDSTTFSGLTAGKSYTFYQRYEETTTMEASPTSDVLKTYTLSTSSDTSDSSATPTPSASSTTSDDSSGSTTLYSYTLTSDNTRILYSTMKSLAAGNKTQDVVIKQSNVEITFPKGTMTDSYTQLWYDFGTTINNSIAEQTAKSLTGDAYVATIHFNYSGELPGKADIRFWLGAAQAGKTLYYYRLEDDNTLTFMQTSTVDSTGWVSVSQTSCSDYVFLSSEYGAAGTVSPLPTSSAGITPTPVPTVSSDQAIAGMSADGWFVVAIIVIAVALIVGGIWLYTKSRDDRMDDDDDDF